MPLLLSLCMLCFALPSFARMCIYQLLSFDSCTRSAEKWEGGSESERQRERERDKGADGMDAKNQQSHVRLIKINSFTLHSLRLSLFLIWRARGVLSKCFLRKKADARLNNNPRSAVLYTGALTFGPVQLPRWRSSLTWPGIWLHADKTYHCSTSYSQWITQAWGRTPPSFSQAICSTSSRNAGEHLLGFFDALPVGPVWLLLLTYHRENGNSILVGSFWIFLQTFEKRNLHQQQRMGLFRLWYRFHMHIWVLV